jgi:hypothetical protein
MQRENPANSTKQKRAINEMFPNKVFYFVKSGFDGTCILDIKKERIDSLFAAS